MSYQVLLRSTICQKCILLVYSSIWTTFIGIVIVNSDISIFRVLVIYIVSYQALLRNAVCQKFILFVYSSIWLTFISIVIVNSAGPISWVLLIYIVSYIVFRFYWSKCFLHGSPIANNILLGLLIYTNKFYYHCHG